MASRSSLTADYSDSSDSPKVVRGQYQKHPGRREAEDFELRGIIAVGNSSNEELSAVLEESEQLEDGAEHRTIGRINELRKDLDELSHHAETIAIASSDLERQIAELLVQKIELANEVEALKKQTQIVDFGTIEECVQTLELATGENDRLQAEMRKLREQNEDLRQNAADTAGLCTRLENAHELWQAADNENQIMRSDLEAIFECLGVEDVKAAVLKCTQIQANYDELLQKNDAGAALIAQLKEDNSRLTTEVAQMRMPEAELRKVQQHARELRDRLEEVEQEKRNCC
jgi:hypothetical protein